MGHGPIGSLPNSARTKKVLDSDNVLFHQVNRSRAPIHYNSAIGVEVYMEKQHYSIWYSQSYCHGQWNAIRRGAFQKYCEEFCIKANSPLSLILSAMGR